MAMFIEEPKRLMITVGLPLGYILHQLSFRPQPSRGKLKGHAATTCAVSQIKTIDYHVLKTFSMAEAGRTLPRRSFGEKERKASFFFFFSLHFLLCFLSAWNMITLSRAVVINSCCPSKICSIPQAKALEHEHHFCSDFYQLYCYSSYDQHGSKT